MCTATTFNVGSDEKVMSTDVIRGTGKLSGKIRIPIARHAVPCSPPEALEVSQGHFQPVNDYG